MLDPPTDAEPVDQLRATAMRLAAELDEVRLYQAAAYVAMAVDAMAPCPRKEARAKGASRKKWGEKGARARVQAASPSRT